jgi:hypothetical protein
MGWSPESLQASHRISGLTVDSLLYSRSSTSCELPPAGSWADRQAEEPARRRRWTGKDLPGMGQGCDRGKAIIDTKLKGDISDPSGELQTDPSCKGGRPVTETYPEKDCPVQIPFHSASQLQLVYGIIMKFSKDPGNPKEGIGNACFNGPLAQL